MGGESKMHGTDRRGIRRRRAGLAAFLFVVAICAATVALATGTKGTAVPPVALWVVTVLAVLAAFPLMFLRRGG